MNPLSALGLVDQKVAALQTTILQADADVVRASGATYRSASVQTTGTEIIQFDLLSSPIPSDEHYVVMLASVKGIITGALPLLTFEPNAAIPGSLTYARAGVSGFSIVTFGEPKEQPAQSVIPGNINLNSRGMQLVTVHGSSPLNALGLGTPPWSFVATPSTQQGGLLILPAGYNLRYTLSMLPGTAAPGPGIGSSAIMEALIIAEKNRGAQR